MVGGFCLALSCVLAVLLLFGVEVVRVLVVVADSFNGGCVVGRPVVVLRVLANGVQLYLSAFLKLVGFQADP